MLKLQNVRLGLATNSSSSHSMVWVPSEMLKFIDDNEVNGRFGWNLFACKSAEAKKIYLAVNLIPMLTSSIKDTDFIKSLLADLFQFENEGSIKLAMDGYIDHESYGLVPNVPTKEIKELVENVGYGCYTADKLTLIRNKLMGDYLSEHVVIVGGNDNSDEEHLACKLGIDYASYLAIFKEIGLVIKNDDNGYITIFNPNTGAKIRFLKENYEDSMSVTPDSFSSHLESRKGAIFEGKAKTPELVDIKITDYCPYGCAYCYQGSTVTGTHADPNYLWDVAQTLSQNGVLEVAIGGGEPTLHPDFVYILELFKSRGIVPNFTTRNLSWLKKEKLAYSIFSNSGSFAVSIDGLGAINELNELMKQYPDELRKKVAVQLVMGTLSQNTFVSILEACHAFKFRVTLLGYKLTGRGIEIVPFDYSWWLSTIEGLANKPSISIDTALALQFRSVLEKNVNPLLYHTLEGKFSMYIDAVTQKMAPSSYEESSKFSEFDGQNENWITTFSHY